MQQNSTKARSLGASAEVLAQSAISAALSSQWLEAIKINQKILANSNNDVEALNRLARAQSCLGEITKAQKTYKRVLEIDPYNIIAIKNVEKISKTNGFAKNQNSSIERISEKGLKRTNGFAQTNLSTVFLYEPGKTKLVNLLNLAPPSVLARLNCGDQVFLNPKSHSVTINSIDNVYLGAFPDDLAHRLLALITGGNEYEAYIKSVTSKLLTIFIREVSRSARFANQPSFQPQNANYIDERNMA